MRDVVDDLVVELADNGALVVVVDAAELDARGILAVFAHVGDDVADADDAALERARTQVADVVLVDVALLDQRVEVGERRAGLGAVLEEGLLAAVRDDAVVGLKAQVGARDGLEQPHAVDVVVEVAPRARMVELGQVVLALVTKRRVPEVVPDGDGLDEVEVEAESGSDGAPDPAHHLQVERAAGNVVVADEAEDLRLVGAA